MGDSDATRATLVLGVGDWGRRVLRQLDATAVERPAALATLVLDHAHRDDDDDAGWERFHFGLTRNFDERPHVWLPSEVLARAPITLGAPRDRAHARLLAVTSQRQLRGFLSLHVHRFASRMHERGIDAIEVLICASLSGITGSGSLLDLAYLVRELLPSQESCSVGALLAMPDEQAPDTEGSKSWQARTYASLIELHHFGRPHSLFSFHDHTGEERPAAGSLPFDWTFLLFGDAADGSPRQAAAEAAWWLAARGTGAPFLPMLSRPRLTTEPHATPLFDTLRTVRLRAPSIWMPELTAIQLARRAVVRWTRSAEDQELGIEGQRLLKDLLEKAHRMMDDRQPSAWSAELSQRCQAVVHKVDDRVARGGDVGSMVWREARLVERRVFSDLDRGARVWGEAADAVQAQFGELREALIEDADSMLARPVDGYQLFASVLAQLRSLLADRTRILKKRIADAAQADAGTRLRKARSELRRLTHVSPGLLGRIRKANDVRVFDAFGEWVRLVPRFALHERDRIVAQVELEALDELLPPLEEMLDDARQRGAALVMVLDQMQTEAANAVFDGPNEELALFPGGNDDPVEAATHLCEVILAHSPDLDTLPGDLVGSALLESDDVEARARQLLAWALPHCGPIRSHLEIDAVIAGAPAGSAVQASLDRAIGRWLAPAVESHPGTTCETRLAVGMPARALGGELERWLREWASSRGIDQLEAFALPGTADLLLCRLDLGFPLGRISGLLAPLRDAYEQLRFGDTPVTLHTRADVSDWADIDLSSPAS